MSLINNMKKVKSKFIEIAFVALSPHVPTAVSNYISNALIDDIFSNTDIKKNTQKICDDRARNFAYVLAIIASKIDNEVDDAELLALNNNAHYITDDFKPTLTKLMNSTIDFNILCQVYKANYKEFGANYKDYGESYINISNEIITRFIHEVINADNFVTPEEEALLIIWGLIKSNYDMLDFYIITDVKKDISLNHKLFSYLLKDDVNTFFPNTTNKLTAGTIAILHPFDDKVLVPFKEIYSDNYANEFCDGILQILQILGVKRVHIKNVTENDTSNKLDVGISSKVDIKSESVNVKANQNIEIISEKINNMADQEEIIAEFSGLNIIQKITNKLFLSYKLSKYTCNHHYSEIIKLASSNHNKIKKFQYTVNYSAYDKAINSLKVATEVGFMAKGINAEIGSKYDFDKSKSNNNRSNKSFLAEF